MADTPRDPRSATADLTTQQRREFVIDAALNYVEPQDWYSAAEDDDPQVVAALERLYATDLQPTPCSGSPLF